MKAMILGILFFEIYLGFNTAAAQTWDELFRQKETQKEYLILQLGALKIQSGLLKEAGGIAQLGLNTISTWKDLEKGLHSDFFGSFKRLGPLSNQALEKLNDSGLHPELLRTRILKSKLYGPSVSQEALFLRWNSKIHLGMLRQCDFFLAELTLILGKDLQMEDADRASFIEKLSEDLMELHRDLGQVQKEVQFRLAHQRQLEYQLQLLNRY